jgi:hypothetical protein
MDDTEKLVQMMGRCGLATGHGDTIDDLIFELEKQIKNTSHAFSDARKQIVRSRDALQFYAEWGIDAPAVDAIIEEDRGDKAREALNIVLADLEKDHYL